MKGVKKLQLLLGCTLFGVSTGALTLPITIEINSVTGTWTDAAINSPRRTTLGGLKSNEIHWGLPLGQNKSGYSFDGLAPPVQGPYDVDQVFDL